MIRSNWGLFLAGAPLAFALAAPTAFAADLPVKALPLKAPVAAPFSWTGWYMGVNAGYGVGQGYGTHSRPLGTVFQPGFLAAQLPTVAGVEAFNAMPAGGLVGRNSVADHRVELADEQLLVAEVESALCPRLQR